MKKDKKKSLLIALIAAGVVVVIYATLLPFYRLMDYIICAAVAILVARLLYVMVGGVDTSKKAPTQKPIPTSGNQEVDELVKRGQNMIAQIKEQNSLIKDEVLSQKINHMESTTHKIFLTVVDKPQKAPEIRRFMEYYLPTTLKMLTSYSKLDQRKITGENADKTKGRIEDAMDVIVKAFDKQLDKLYSDDMLDISSDIDVLETMMKQDGLSDSVFTQSKK